MRVYPATHIQQGAGSVRWCMLYVPIQVSDELVPTAVLLTNTFIHNGQDLDEEPEDGEAMSDDEILNEKGFSEL